MKKHVLIFGSLVIFLGGLIGFQPLVHAQEDTDATNENSNEEIMQTTATDENDTSDATGTEAKDKSAGREARIKAYKEKTTAKIAESKAKRITTRCKSAQGKVTSLRARVQGVVTKRTQSYTTISDKLDVLVERLIKAGVDTAPLEKAREDVRSDLAVLAESMAAYDTVLADIEAMDCEADPQTFSAAVESAREMQKTLRDQAQEFRRFATNELKTAIQEMRVQLEAKTTAEGVDQ